MSTSPSSLSLDLNDFDAVGIANQLVVSLRGHAIEASVDAAATVAPPAGWHPLVVTARRSGHVVLGVRYSELSTSRWNNIGLALTKRGWHRDEDDEGATMTFPPGTDATTVAFEILAAATVAGAPADVRAVTAVDGHGAPVSLD